MDAEVFKNYCQGVSAIISAIAIVIAGGFAFYKFVWIEQDASETTLANLVGEARAQVGVSSTLEIAEIYLNNNAENAASFNLTAMHYCPEGEDDSAECRNEWRTITVPRLEIQSENACELSEDQGHLSAVLSGWNLVFNATLENKSTVPIDFRWKELKLFETDNLRVYGDGFDQEKDLNQIRSIPLKEITHVGDLSGLFLGRKGTEIGVGYENSMTAIGKMWLPFECGEKNKTIVFRFLADVAHVVPVNAVTERLQSTEKFFFHLCELSRTEEKYQMWGAKCGEYVTRFHSQ